MPNAILSGTGFHVPERVVTNEDLKAYFETSDEWIRTRSGIEERRWIRDDEETGASDLALPAVEMALEDAGLQAKDLDMIVFATLSPDALFPGSGVFLQRKLGLSEIPALDIRMQCSGFVYALSIAELYVKSGRYRNVAVVGAEVHSTGLDRAPEGRDVSVLFGDGAGVAIVSAGEDGERGIQSSHLHSQGEYAEKLWVPEPNSNSRPRYKPGTESGENKGIYPHMDGREVFKHAIARMSEALHEALQANDWQLSEIDLIIPHQANLRIAQTIAEKLNLPMERFYMNIQRYGNTTAGSIPIAIAEAQREGKLKRGDKLIVMSFGSGFTWASAAIVY